VVLFVRLTPAQQAKYRAAVAIGAKDYNGTSASAFQTVHAMRKIANDPGSVDLETCSAAAPAAPAAATPSSNPFSSQQHPRPAPTLPAAALPTVPHRPVKPAARDIASAIRENGKLATLLELLTSSKKAAPLDRFVLISNFTTTLDLFEGMLKFARLPFVRLDGSIAANKRQARVDSFNEDPSIFAFLLSSKAGGCGINLIGANRLVLFDPDWNPAADQQALARVWRSGQKKPCFIYRMVAVGTLEEVCIDRQSAKEGLAGEIVDGDGDARKFSADELSSLFQPTFDTISASHDRLGCQCCAPLPAGATPRPPPTPDADGFLHLLPGAAELAQLDPVLAAAAPRSGVSLAYARRTDKSEVQVASPSGG
jgi:SNF2 family DNA or RNA helicase